MKTNEIYTAFIAWPGGGKRRPVLVLDEHQGFVTVFGITSKYETKSPIIKAKYFPILDWRAAGLVKPSYVDTGTIRSLPLKKVSFHRVGRLTDRDALRLLEFQGE